MKRFALGIAVAPCSRGKARQGQKKVECPRIPILTLAMEIIKISKNIMLVVKGPCSNWRVYALLLQKYRLKVHDPATIALDNIHIAITTDTKTKVTKSNEWYRDQEIEMQGGKKFLSYQVKFIVYRNTAPFNSASNISFIAYPPISL